MQECPFNNNKCAVLINHQVAQIALQEAVNNPVWNPSPVRCKEIIIPVNGNQHINDILCALIYQECKHRQWRQVLDKTILIE